MFLQFLLCKVVLAIVRFQRSEYQMDKQKLDSSAVVQTSEVYANVVGWLIMIMGRPFSRCL